MRTLTGDQTTALLDPRTEHRVFVEMDILDGDGDPAPLRMWNDVGHDPTIDGKTFKGGILAGMPSLRATGDASIKQITISLSLLSQDANNAVRAYIVQQRPVTVWVGLYNPVTHMVYEPLIPFFKGFIDRTPLHTPAKDGLSVIEIMCESILRAGTKKGTATRSKASMEELSPDDRLFDYTGAQAEKRVYFGQKSPVDQAAKSARLSR